MREEGLGEEVLVVLQRGLAHEDRQLVEVQQLGVALDAGDRHPVEGEERDHHEEDHRDVDPEEPGDEGIADLDPAARGLVAPAQPAGSPDLLGDVGLGHYSGRLKSRSTTPITTVRTGKRKSETAAPTLSWLPGIAIV